MQSFCDGIRQVYVRSRITAFVPLVALLLAGGCSPRPDGTAELAAKQARAAADRYLTYLTPQALGAPIDQPPWIAHVLPVDLDRDGLMDLVFCESRQNKIIWLRQTSPGNSRKLSWRTTCAHRCTWRRQTWTATATST